MSEYDAVGSGAGEVLRLTTLFRAPNDEEGAATTPLVMFDNLHQVEAAQAHNLTAEDFLPFPWFNSEEHQQALSALLLRELPFEFAMRQLAGLEPGGLMGIAQGFNRLEVAVLDNPAKQMAYADLLREEAYVSLSDFIGADWLVDQLQSRALCELVVGQQYSVDGAMSVLSSLSPAHAYGLAFGLSLEQVQGVDDEIDILNMLEDRDRALENGSSVKLLSRSNSALFGGFVSFDGADVGDSLDSRPGI